MGPNKDLDLDYHYPVCGHVKKFIASGLLSSPPVVYSIYVLYVFHKYKTISLSFSFVRFLRPLCVAGQ